MSDTNFTLQLTDVLEGHSGWVTSLSTCAHNPNVLASGSRDKTIIVWELTPNDTESVAYPKHSFTGHSHIVQDVKLSYHGDHLLSASWDKTARLWRLSDGSSTRFVGHEGDVLSCSFIIENGDISVATSSRDKTIRLWETNGRQKSVFESKNGHSDWVSAIDFVNNEDHDLLFSAGWDKTVKLWNVSNGTAVVDLKGFSGYVNTVASAPDGSIGAAGGKDGNIHIWSLKDLVHACSFNVNCEVHSLSFSNSRFWIAAATENGIRIFDLQQNNVVTDLVPEATGESSTVPVPLSLAWSADGQILFAGYTDNKIRAWRVMCSMASA